MKISKLYIFICIATFSLYSTDIQNGILSPGPENRDVAMFNGDAVTEFQVFGYPSVKSRAYLSAGERTDKIEEYIFDIILQKEGSIPSVLNSEEYKKNYTSLIDKNSVMKLRSDLVSSRFQKDSNRTDEETRRFLDDYIDSVLTVYKVKYDEVLFLKIAGIKTDSVEKFTDTVQSDYPNQVLISWKDQRITTGDLVRVAKNVKPYHLKNLNDAKILKRMTDGRIVNEILTLEAEKHGYKKDPDVISETEAQIRFLVSKKYLEILSSEDKFLPEKEEMIDYYIANKDDRSLWSRRKMWVFEIFMEYNNEDPDKKNDKINVAIEIENVRQKVLAGENFEKYAKFYPRPHTNDGELGFIFEDDYALIGKTAAKMNAGDISDLIIQQKAISVIKVTQVQEPMLYKFDYVEEIIKRRLIDSKRKNFLDNLKTELFKKYKVEILNQN